MKREFSAGGVVFKKQENGEILWLITKTAPNTKFFNSYWRLPKGWIDDKDNGKSPGPIASGAVKATEKELEKAALREVREEGGINAKIIRKL